MLSPASIQKPLQILLLLFLIVAGLYYAKPFLAPFFFGGLMAMLFLPLCRWLEGKKWPRALAIVACLLVLLGVIALIALLISWQVTDLAREVSVIETRVEQLMGDAKEFVSSKFGIPVQQQNEILERQSQTNAGIGFLSQLGSGLMSFLVDFILFLVYIFLFLYYRGKIRRFVLQLISNRQQGNAEQVIYDVQKIAQRYLAGMAWMILSLWVLYSIGFSLVGVKYAVFFAVLCGILEIVPFIGNLVGNLLAISMVIIQGGGAGMVVAVLIVYASVQFFQSYILEPLVVGAGVNINPLFTIIGLVVGELVWGIAGMVLAIPLLGIIKIICDHVQELKPYGELIGRPARGKGRGSGT